MHVVKLSDRLVGWREALLNRVLGAPACASTSHIPASSESGHIAGELRIALNQLWACHISTDGAHVGYALIRQSEDYAAYRDDLLPRLRAFDPASLTTREDKLAFWINFYNALVIDSVIQFDISQSVTEGATGSTHFLPPRGLRRGR